MKRDIKKMGATLLACNLVFVLITTVGMVLEQVMKCLLTKNGIIGAPGFFRIYEMTCYLAAILPELLIVTIYIGRYPKFSHVFRRSSRRMTWRVLLLVGAGLMMSQLIFDITSTGLESLFRQVGLSLQEQVEAASGSSETALMLVYTVVVGPIAEELIFRGAVLHTLSRYGRSFAIAASAVLFGIYHGNLPQGIFAVCMGLIFGYIATEYSIYWSILIHMLNNLYSAGNEYIMSCKAASVVSSITIAVYIGAILLILVCGIRHREQIRVYLHRERGVQGACRALCLSGSILAFTMMNVATMVLSITAAA